MIDLDIGGGESASVTEPTRLDFDNNLGGALQFLLAHTLYHVLSFAGSAVGDFLAGVAVKFLDRIEPGLVDYARPLIDQLLENPDLPPEIREFMENLRIPLHESGAAILAGFSQQAGGAVMGGLLDVALRPAMYWLNSQYESALPGVGELAAMQRRGLITTDHYTKLMSFLGYPESIAGDFAEITRPRAGVADIVDGLYRGNITESDASDALDRLGIPRTDQELIVRNRQQKLSPPDILQAVLRGEMPQEVGYDYLTKLGFDVNDLDQLRRNMRRIMAPGDLLETWHRGLLSADECRSELLSLGFADIDVTSMMQLSYRIPGPGDLISMAVREAFDDGVAAKYGYDDNYPEEFATYMAQQGYSDEWARRWWRSHWNLPSLTQGYEMYHRNIIDRTSLDELMRVQDIPTYWRTRLHDVAYNVLTRVDVRRMYGLGVLTREEVKRAYLDYGYNDLDAERLTEFTIRYEDDDGASTRTQVKILTKSAVQASLEKNIITEDEAGSYLSSMGYADEERDVMLALWSWTRDIATTQDYTLEFKRDVLAIVERAYARRMLTTQEATSALVDVGYTDDEITYKLAALEYWGSFEDIEGRIGTIATAYTNRALSPTDAVGALGQLGIPSQQQDSLLSQWEWTRTHRARRLTESQYRRAFNEHHIGIEDYREALRGLDYTEPDIELMVKMYLVTE